MRRKPIAAFLIFCIFLFAHPLFSQTTIFSEPLSDRIANYNIAVSLNDTAKTLDAEVKIVWNNPSSDTIPDLQFHLYLNAFKNAISTFSKKSRGSKPWVEKNASGWTEISQMKIRGVDHTDQMQFIAPDDGNADDQTVLQIVLEKPVLPGETIEIAYTFHVKIPRNHSRTGWWGDDFFFMVQWFPKIGVYETPGMRLVPAEAARGQWNCHQFHPNTEFYADFGVYNVQITVPVKYTVAATGVIQRERVNDDNTKTIFFHAEDVHDFAWLADATVLDVEETWHNKRSGQMVKIRLLLQPGHESAKDAYFESAKYTLQYFDDWLGEGAYPYPQLTIVDPLPGSGAGGMEYPTLITGGVFYPARWWTRNKIRIVESVTIHELAHQYWYGMVANNEFEEAFLDEGFTTYSENRIGAEMFGERTSLLDFAGLKASLEAMRRPFYTLSKGNRDATISDFSYTTRESRNLAYNKWSLALKTLENLLGRQNFDEILRTYFQRWRYRHPSRNDFIAVANEVADKNLDWFFDQIIFADGVVDYGVAEVNKHDVMVRRSGEVKIPVEVLIEFSNGSQVIEKWNGQTRTKKFTYSEQLFVKKVVIDPELKILLDINLMNNSFTPVNRHFMQKYLSKWFFWMQSILALLATIS